MFNFGITGGCEIFWHVKVAIVVAGRLIVGRIAWLAWVKAKSPSSRDANDSLVSENTESFSGEAWGATAGWWTARRAALPRRRAKGWWTARRAVRPRRRAKGWRTARRAVRKWHARWRIAKGCIHWRTWRWAAEGLWKHWSPAGNIIKVEWRSVGQSLSKRTGMAGGPAYKSSRSP